MLNEELRRTPHCEHIEVTGVYGVDDESVDFNWRAQALRSRTREPVTGDCMRVVEDASNRGWDSSTILKDRIDTQTIMFPCPAPAEADAPYLETWSCLHVCPCSHASPLSWQLPKLSFP
jgi:hypothetical protein